MLAGALRLTEDESDYLYRLAGYRAWGRGTSAQRVKWYKKGLETGDMSQLQVIFDLPYEQL